MQLLDNLAKQTSTFSHRAIKYGVPLRVQIPGSEKGLLVGAIYGPDKTLYQVRYDGIAGNMKITADNPTGTDSKDGIIEFYILAVQNGYTLHVQAFDSMTEAVPQAWNISFDVVK